MPRLIKSRMIVSDVRLVGNFREDVTVSVIEDPRRCGVTCAMYGRFILQAFVLAEVKVAKDDHHSEFIGTIENALKSRGIVCSQRAIGIERGVFPRLVFRVTLGRAALKV